MLAEVRGFTITTLTPKGGLYFTSEGDPDVPNLDRT